MPTSSSTSPILTISTRKKGTKLVSIGTVHYEPFGIYAGKTKSLGALKDGAMVAVPNDTTNEARALLLLQSNGLIVEGRRRPHCHPPRHRGKPQEAQDRRNRSGSARPRPA